MDFRGKKRAAELEQLLRAQRSENQRERARMQGTLDWMLSTASAEQVARWGEDALGHLDLTGRGDVDDPDWEARAAEVLKSALLRILQTQGELKEAQERLERIARAHQGGESAAGAAGGTCAECRVAHPCPTYVWATTKRDALLDPWDPRADMV